MSSSSLFHLLSVYSHVSPIRDILQTFAAAAALRFRLMEASHISTSVQTADVGGARTSHPDIGVKGKMFILAFHIQDSPGTGFPLVHFTSICRQ